MARSVWKGPFVHPSLLKKVERGGDALKRPIKTWSRSSTIVPEFVGLKFEIHNGKKFIPITISDEMVGHKLESLHLQEHFLVILLQIKKLEQQLPKRMLNNG
jgi:small subunit ribosomal protein S19